MFTIAPPVTHDFVALGTRCRVAVTQAEHLDKAVTATLAVLAKVDDACSRFRVGTELDRLNRAGGRPQEVSALFITALDVALRAAVLSDGCVDPTVGSAVCALGYAVDFGELAPDGPAIVPVVTSVPGWRCIDVDRASRTVRIPAGVRLDLDATAKALAADMAASAAWLATGCGVLIDLGGDISVAGTGPADGWLVRVTHDLNSDGQLVTLHDGGLATSGTTIRRWTRGGVDHHHIVDPSTSQSAPERILAASVAGSSCVDANVASTAAIVQGLSAIQWLEETGLPARLVLEDGSAVVIGKWPAEVAA